LEPQDIIKKILEVYKKCEIRSFPIDCIKIIKHLGIPLFRYSQLTEPKKKNCLQVSNDAFTLQNAIFYNDHFPHIERQRFSLMHEVGHIVLGHTGNCAENEKEADFFSSNILAPRSAMYHLHCVSVKKICNTFNVSCMAANRIANEYQTYCFWENKELHSDIRDWFFPCEEIATPTEIIEEIENNAYDSNFFNIRHFLNSEEYILEQLAQYRMGGY
jgi:hypothetical protein